MEQLGSVASQGAIEPFFVIAAGGPEPQPADLAQLFEGAHVIAADGGWRLCRQLGVAPRLVIGDLDTLTPAEVEQARADGSEVSRFPVDKDQSDLELAIEAAHRLGARRLTLVGALGGQWDHCLANLLAPLSRCRELGIWARLVSLSTEIYLLTPGAYRVETPVGTRISLAALSLEVLGLNLSGFSYELHDGSLRRSQTRGLANLSERAQATVELTQGELFMTLISSNKSGMT